MPISKYRKYPIITKIAIDMKCLRSVHSYVEKNEKITAFFQEIRFGKTSRKPHLTNSLTDTEATYCDVIKKACIWNRYLAFKYTNTLALMFCRRQSLLFKTASKQCNITSVVH